MIAKNREIAALKARIAALTPQSSPGMRTSRTTRGVIRRPVVTAQSGQASTPTVPRWA
jgi:hypothetical protein